MAEPLAADEARRLEDERDLEQAIAEKAERGEPLTADEARRLRFAVMALEPGSDELDWAVAEKAERGEPLIADEERRLAALEARFALWLGTVRPILDAYANEAIGAEAVDVEMEELELDRAVAEKAERGERLTADEAGRLESQSPLHVRVIRRVRAARRTAGSAPAPPRSAGALAVTRRPRPRERSRHRGPPRGGGADDGGSDPPPLAAAPARRLTSEMRQQVKAALDAGARRRVEREKKLRLPDGIDRILYCARGLHLRKTHWATYPSGKGFCKGCKADDDARRSCSQETCWWPALPSRLVATAERLLVEPPHLAALEFGDPGIQEGQGWRA